VLDDDELLVVTTASTNPFVQQHFSPRHIDHGPELSVLLLAELGLIRVGAPYQTTHMYPLAGEASEHSSYLRSWTAESLVRVTAPIGEEHQVPRAKRA
jgi:hypothetical protein